MSLTSMATRGVLWVFVGKSGARLLTTVVLVLLARLLEPADFGVVALAAFLVAFLVLLRDQGFAPALIQKRELGPADLDTAFWTSAGLGLCLTVAVAAAAGPIAQLLDEPRLTRVLQVLSLTFLVGGMRSVPAAILARALNFRALAVRQLVGTASGGVVGVTMALRGAGVWALVGQALTDVVVETLVVAVSVHWRPSLAWSATAFRGLVGFSSNTLGVQILNFLSRRSDDLLVGAFLGPVALGIYSVAYRLLRLVIELCVEIITEVGLPTLSRLQSDLVRLRQGADTAMATAAVLCVPTFAFLAVCSDDVVTVAFGAKWLPAADCMAILALGGMVSPVLTLQMQALTAAGKPRSSLVLALVNGLTSVAAFAIGVQFGVLAVAAAYSIRAYVVLPAGFAVTQRQIGLRASGFLRAYAVPFGASAAMVGVVVLLRSAIGAAIPTSARLAVLGLVGFGVYAVGVRALAPQQTQQLVLLVRTAVGRVRQPTTPLEPDSTDPN